MLISEVHDEIKMHPRIIPYMQAGVQFRKIFITKTCADLHQFINKPSQAGFQQRSYALGVMQHQRQNGASMCVRLKGEGGRGQNDNHDRIRYCVQMGSGMMLNFRGISCNSSLFMYPKKAMLYESTIELDALPSLQNNISIFFRATAWCTGD